jgi:hypothetical protein
VHHHECDRGRPRSRSERPRRDFRVRPSPGVGRSHRSRDASCVFHGRPGRGTASLIVWKSSSCSSGKWMAGGRDDNRPRHIHWGSSAKQRRSDYQSVRSVKSGGLCHARRAEHAAIGANASSARLCPCAASVVGWRLVPGRWREEIRHRLDRYPLAVCRSHRCPRQHPSCRTRRRAVCVDNTQPSATRFTDGKGCGRPTMYSRQGRKDPRCLIQLRGGSPWEALSVPGSSGTLTGCRRAVCSVPIRTAGGSRARRGGGGSASG